jgi:hypothetical protein
VTAPNERRWRRGGSAGLGRAIVTGCAVLSATPAGAQEPPRFEIAAGGVWTSGHPVGSAVATLTANAPGAPATAPFILFRTDSTLEAASGGEWRLGFRLVRDLSIEAGLVFRRPPLRTSIAGDTEAGGGTYLAEERLSEFVLDFAAILKPRRVRFASGRGRPYVQGGLLHLRQLHSDRVVVETGWGALAGGGVAFYWVERPAGLVRALGLRMGVRAELRSGGVDLADRRHVVGTGGAALVVGF